MHCKLRVIYIYLDDVTSATTEANIEDTTIESVLEVSDNIK